MRYTIPKNSKIMKKESDRILRSFTGTAVNKVIAALDFIRIYSDENHTYIGTDYDALYALYRSLGIMNNQNKDDLFPRKNRSEEAFRRELEKLWQLFELHTLEEEYSLPDIRKRYEADQEKYINMLKEQEITEENQSLETNQSPEKKQDENIRLIDNKSPYYEYVSGTLYEELSKRWNVFKQEIDTTYYAPGTFLAEDITKLLSKMQDHFIRRNNMGSFIPMSQEEYQDIHHLYKECIRDMKRLQDSEKLSEYKNLYELLRHNEIQLTGLAGVELPPLASALDSEPVQTIRLEASKDDSVGANMSAREAIEYTDKDGVKHQGFFTPETQVMSKTANIRQVLEEYKDKYPRYADFFAKFVDPGVERRPYDEIVEAAKKVKKNIDSNALTNYFTNQVILRDWDDDPKRLEVFLEFAESLRKRYNALGVYKGSGIGEGNYIAERAGAMTDVASSLGFSNLLAGSKRVTVEREGKKVDGIFMESAVLDGVDPNHITKDHPFLKTDAKEFDSREVLSSLADLQIIDYLCANTDRHAANFFLRLDSSDPDHPKFTGVVGIDNDNSFGKIVEGGMMRLAESEELKIITPKMADAITAMTDEKLHDILAGYHLSKMQLQSAEIRLDRLKSMIANGRKSTELKFKDGEVVNDKGVIHIVKDNEWSELTMDKLVPKKIVGYQESDGKEVIATNIFTMAVSRRKAISEIVAQFNTKEPTKRVQPKDPIVYNTHSVTMNYEKIARVQLDEIEQLKAIKNGFIENGGNESSRSRKFKTMKAELDNLITEYTKLHNFMNLKDTELITGKKDEELAERYRELNKKREKLNTSIDKYLGKLHISPILTLRNFRRIDLAEKLAAMVKNPTLSERIFEGGKVLRIQYTEEMGSKNAYQLNSYVTNQIYSMMHDTLRDNVASLENGDKKRALGVKAIDAQERLWKYGQNDGVIQEKKDEKDQKAREKVSIGSLEDDVKKEAALNPDMDKICKDLNALKRYEPALTDKIDKMMEDKEKITPHKVKEVLQDLLIIGNKNLEKKKAGIAKETAVKDANASEEKKTEGYIRSFT